MFVEYVSIKLEEADTRVTALLALRRRNKIGLLTTMLPWLAASAVLLCAVPPTLALSTGPSISMAVVKEQSDLLDKDLEIPSIAGMENADLQQSINDRLESDVRSFAREMEEAAIETKEWLDTADSEGLWAQFPFAAYTRWNTRYVSASFVSLTCEYYCYLGGAHGSTDMVAYNIDLETGEDIELEDLFDDCQDYAAPILEEINRQISLEPDLYFPDAVPLSELPAEPKFCIARSSNDDVASFVVYFAQYEIAPYSSGIREFAIPLSQLQQLLSPAAASLLGM